MIYGVHAQQSLKPVNARRLHKRAGPVVLPLVRGPGVISVEVQLFETGSARSTTSASSVARTLRRRCLWASSICPSHSSTSRSSCRGGMEPPKKNRAGRRWDDCTACAGGRPMPRARRTARYPTAGTMWFISSWTAAALEGIRRRRCALLVGQPPSGQIGARPPMRSFAGRLSPIKRVATEAPDARRGDRPPREGTMTMCVALRVTRR